jgi:RNA polymerase sigma factor (sigma-70 family)
MGMGARLGRAGSTDLTAVLAGDGELLAGLAAGEAGAAEAFVARFERRVFGLALSVLGNPSSADEVAQQAFERAWRRASTFDPARGSVAGWLLAITRNLAIDELRRQRPRATDLGDLSSLHALASADVPEETVVIGTEVDAVRAALDLLPLEQRRAVLLAAWHGRTAAEIAQIEGIPLGTAKTRIRSGLRRLRALLGARTDAGAGGRREEVR